VNISNADECNGSERKCEAYEFHCGILQAACDEGAEKYERAFVLQLLASGSSGGSKEVLNCLFCVFDIK
jgi:hypothetical protein